MGGSDASQKAGGSALSQDSNTGGSQETNVTPPQGDFIIGGWYGFHITDETIRLTTVANDGSEVNEYMSGTLVKKGSSGSSTTWQIEGDEPIEGKEVYVQIPNGVSEGDVEGTWTVMIVVQNNYSNGVENCYYSHRFQFNADGSAYRDRIEGTASTANIIDNDVTHEEIQRMYVESGEDPYGFDGNYPDGIDYILSIEKYWYQTGDGTFSYNDSSIMAINPA